MLLNNVALGNDEEGVTLEKVTLGFIILDNSSFGKLSIKLVKEDKALVN